MKLLHSLSNAFLVALVASSAVDAHVTRKRATKGPGATGNESVIISDHGHEIIDVGKQGGHRPPPSGHPLKSIVDDGAKVTIQVNTTGAAPDTGNATTSRLKSRAITGTSVSSTILILARDAEAAYSAYSGLNGYGIPYQVVLVPQAGTALPTLSSGTTGNYGGIVLVSEVSYDMGGGNYASAITQAQFDTLYAYQLAFGVRMVRIDVYPDSTTGTAAVAGCCSDGVEQLMSINNTSPFPSAGFKAGATLSTNGLWHYMATISNSAIATPFAQFAPASGSTSPTVAGVINNISGRQQMVFFISWATQWAGTSNILQHAWITWVTHGIYTGYRRVYLNTQVDDMFLTTEIFSPSGSTFRVRPGDLAQHITWQADMRSRMNTGSNFTIELAHNGNGNIDYAENFFDFDGTCGSVGAIYLDGQTETELEFQKPLGSGTNLWPATPTAYPTYPSKCVNADPLKTFLAVASNRNAFMHMSHTFTHENENNATYFDINKEITWNQGWLSQVGIASATQFSSKSLIPPAITGLHNGDALQAWHDAGLTACVGDNSRPVLMNSQNEHWPYITTVASNGYAGMEVIPRYALAIYYNCDTPACTLAEWVQYSAGSGDYANLLNYEKGATNWRLFGLHHDPYMFHQANMRQTDAGMTTINGVSKKYSIMQAWIETVAQEFTRIVNWPIISLKMDSVATGYMNRMARDNCAPKLTYTLNPSTSVITGVTLSANGNTCSAALPITIPGTSPVTATSGYTSEKIGNDPTTIWTQLTGSAKSYTLTTPIPL